MKGTGGGSKRILSSWNHMKDELFKIHFKYFLLTEIFSVLSFGCDPSSRSLFIHEIRCSINPGFSLLGLSMGMKIIL